MNTVIKLSEDIQLLRSKRITRLAFRRRFTFDERVSIESAARSDTQVNVLLIDQAAASFIDLDDPATSAGVALLVEKTLITAQRAKDILLAEVRPDEMFLVGD